MPRITKKECWDILEDRLVTISENRIGKHCGECKLAIAVLISAGREEDFEFIKNDRFDFFCRLAKLDIKTSRTLILNTIEYLGNGGSAKFRHAILEI